MEDHRRIPVIPCNPLTFLTSSYSCMGVPYDSGLYHVFMTVFHPSLEGEPICLANTIVVRLPGVLYPSFIFISCEQFPALAGIVPPLYWRSIVSRKSGETYLCGVYL